MDSEVTNLDQVKAFSSSDYATAAQGTTADNALPKAGGTMTGAITLSGDPTQNNHAVTKTYVDSLIAAGIHYHVPVRVEVPDDVGSLNTTYNNGTSGVGATLTNAGTQEALVIDGVTLVASDRVLIYNQSNAFENGIYTVTNVGSASTNWVLTRATDADSYGVDNNSLSEGTSVFVKEGDSGSGEVYACTTTGTITFGTTAINFSQIGKSAVLTGGTGITVDGNEINVTNNSIGATQLNVSGNGTSGQVLKSDGDGTFSWANDNDTTYSVGDGGLTQKNFTTALNTKLDGIETGATADQTAGEIKTAYESNADTNAFTDAEQSKLSGIEASADVTDTANVTAAGALMDSEVTNLAQVKAFDSADYATAAQGSTADSALQNISEDTTPQLGGNLDTNGYGITLGDGDHSVTENHILLGNNGDLDIYHSSLGSVIGNNTGDLYLSNIANDADVRINTKKSGSTGATVAFLADGSTGESILYYDGAQKIASKSTGVDVTGNITVSGTVDGRDVATDGTKLDGIETGATADQTASEILTAIKTVDGSNSGLDADLLDGNEASAFATSAQGSTADSALQNVSEDTTPQLGGTLECNGHGINVDQGDVIDIGGLRISTYNSYNTAVIDTLGTAGTAGHIYLSPKGGSSLYIKQGANALFSSENMAHFIANGTVRLYYDNSLKFETTSTGIKSFGDIDVNGAYTLPTSDGTNGQVLTTDGSGAVTFQDASGGGLGEGKALVFANLFG